MAWFKKSAEGSELPASLKDKSAEEIERAVERAGELETENAELKTQVGNLNNKFETFTTDVGGKLDALTNRLAPPQQENNGDQREPASFLVDGDRAFAERAQPLYAMILSTAESNAKQDALRQAYVRQRTIKNNIDGTLFERFESELVDLAKGCSPQQRAISSTWEHLFYNVKGRHSDTIAEHNREHKGDFFVESAERMPAKQEGESDVLTPLEASIAKKMGVAPEKYLAQKKGMSTTGLPVELAGAK